MGLIFIAVIMIPNVVFAIKCKDGFDNKWNNKYVEVTEQVGRLGCFGFMIINIPGTWFGWWSDEAFALYLIVDTILVIRFPVRMILWICMKSLIRDAVSFFSFLVKKFVVICKNLSRSTMYIMEASDEEFDTEEVRKLVKRLDELDPIPLPWKSDEEALKDFWDYCEERQREERIISEMKIKG